MSEKTPVALLTGFLGSGKTTLLQRLLSHPDMGETAVIVNELGEVAIDHHLLRRVDERTVVLGNGCVCCSLRGDLADELRDRKGHAAVVDNLGVLWTQAAALAGRPLDPLDPELVRALG